MYETKDEFLWGGRGKAVETNTIRARGQTLFDCHMIYVWENETTNNCRPLKILMYPLISDIPLGMYI